MCVCVCVCVCVCMCMCVCMHVIKIPSQFSISTLGLINPDSQTHLNEPLVLLHLSLFSELQLCNPIAHSSISIEIISQ